MRKQLTYLILTIVVSVSIESFGWREVGNGGDYVRSQFLRVGEIVIKYLNETQEGQDLVKEFLLDTSVLIKALDVSKIKVVDLDLVDNTSSIVDAIGIPGLILLNHAKWLDHFNLDRDVYHLVFHEVMRSSGINDDNFKISKSIFVFPLNRKIKTSLTYLYPLVRGSVKDFIKGEVGFAGTGCLSSLDDHFIDFDSEWNILTLALENFNLKPNAQSPLARKACALSIPINLPLNYKLEITQAEFSVKYEVDGVATLKSQLEIFSAGSVGKIIPEILKIEGKQKGRMLIRSTNVFKSECGFSGNLRFNTSAQVVQESGLINASADRFKLYFNLIPCPL
jgi:hypothetical protein